MEELIKIQKSESGKNVVDLRELHDRLESKQEFANWAKNKVVENSIFVENEDYCLLDNSIKQKNGRGGHNRKDYAVTLNTAKQVALMENTEKGKQIRQYFIECEKQLQGSIQNALPSNYKEALQQLLLHVEMNEKQQKKLEEQKPKVVFADSVEASHDSVLIGQLAKTIKQKGCDMGQNRLFEWMRENGYLGKYGNNYNLPTQKSMDMGLFEITQTTINRSAGVQLKRGVRVTGKGQIYFTNKFITS